MAITIGQKLGAYEIVSLLGKGGMGEVYRARDSKLKRDVAIKVLPEVFARDTERLARFQREAEVLASLNHPHIAAIHDLQEFTDSRCLILELVEGETLAERIARGPIPIDETLAIAKQIAEALEAAHEKGIVHRDLKPANVKITPDGTVKVLDFGLAKAFEMETANADLSNSPTMMSRPATGAGIILGTAAYMSPEQAKGRPVDRRTDVFAFGCAVYEMLTGRAAFDGEDITEILGRVVTAEPDWTRVPAATPPPIERMLRRALKKDPRQRLGDMRDARLDIEEALQEPASLPASPAVQRSLKFWRAAMLAALAVIATLSIPVFRHLREVPSASPSEIHLELTTPPTTDPTSFAISPDGHQIVFVTTAQGRPALWLRPLDSSTPRVLPGTNGASVPFWSANNRSIAFFADGKLKRIDVDSGAVQVLADAPFGLGGSWSKDGVILFSPVPSSPLLRVSDKGGPAVAATELTSVEGGHDSAEFLPDGRHFLYSVYGGDVFVGELDSAASKHFIFNRLVARWTISAVLHFQSEITTRHLCPAPGR